VFSRYRLLNTVYRLPAHHSQPTVFPSSLFTSSLLSFFPVFSGYRLLNTVYRLPAHHSRPTVFPSSLFTSSLLSFFPVFSGYRLLNTVYRLPAHHSRPTVFPSSLFTSSLLSFFPVFSGYRLLNTDYRLPAHNLPRLTFFIRGQKRSIGCWRIREYLSLTLRGSITRDTPARTRAAPPAHQILKQPKTKLFYRQ